MARVETLATIRTCLLYTSDAADERSSVDLGGRRIIKKKKSNIHGVRRTNRNSNTSAGDTQQYGVSQTSTYCQH